MGIRSLGNPVARYEAVWKRTGLGAVNAPYPGGGTWFGSRGLFSGGYDGSYRNYISYITIASTGNATDFGDLTANRMQTASLSDGYRGVIGGGREATNVDVNKIESVIIPTTGNATDFGDLTQAREAAGAASNGSRGVFAAGHKWPGYSEVIDYITIQTPGNATDFGNMNTARAWVGYLNSDTRGVFAGGEKSGGWTNEIEYITIATTGNGTDFGDLQTARNNLAGVSNGTRGCFGGGYLGPGSSPTYYNMIGYITIASTGNATDFGDLTQAREGDAGASNGTSNRGCFAGGNNANGGNYHNIIDYITITSTGDASDFGDLTSSYAFASGTSGG
tara:strand:+ start:419 stop:1420 length:1002 start_codon:yes stop_codon:yes gene_type:complete